jgi:uncharacterized phosphosugar-binding protein
MKVVALLSRQFSETTTSRHSSGKKLGDVADVVIDIKCVAGDASLHMDAMEMGFCATSTVLGMVVMESIVAQTVENCVLHGIFLRSMSVPIWTEAMRSMRSTLKNTQNSFLACNTREPAQEAY